MFCKKKNRFPMALKKYKNLVSNKKFGHKFLNFFQTVKIGSFLLMQESLPENRRSIY